MERTRWRVNAYDMQDDCQLLYSIRLKICGRLLKMETADIMADADISTRLARCAIGRISKQLWNDYDVRQTNSVARYV